MFFFFNDDVRQRDRSSPVTVLSEMGLLESNDRINHLSFLSRCCNRTPHIKTILKEEEQNRDEGEMAQKKLGGGRNEGGESREKGDLLPGSSLLHFVNIP